ncbi:SusC/RagA family TonB-linked outer membrane protein [Puteibacter caeruleilacunae]|nr:SusC/RagA family TonB-linked outer membrane protein [Puteibacter caeruleilacunae]
MFLLYGAIGVSANTLAQESEVTLNVKHAQLKAVLWEIHEQTGLVFLYSEDDVRGITISNLKAKNSKVEQVLKSCLKNTKLEYEFHKDAVALRVKKAPVVKQAPPQSKKVKGKVVDSNGASIPGATVQIKNQTRGVITDIDGMFSIDAAPSDVLVVSFIGFTTLEVAVGSKVDFEIELKEKTEELEDITVVAFGKQKKESVMASIETVTPGELKVPSSNLTTAMSGRVSGLISYQRSGEPGQDDASFFVRGVTSFTYASGPLILIDGVEMSSSDLSRMQPDDIASFSIMKDAAATALYGARGANGVIMITTKEGKEGKVQVSIRHETSISTPTQDIELADPITYMKLNNEAVYTRDPMKPTPYSLEKIEMTEAGGNPYVYPSNDWYNMLFQNHALNYRTNFNVSGGGKIARYYIAGTYNQDNGVLKVDKRNNFNSNIDLKNYLIRSNINIDITKSTQAVVRLYGTFKDYIGPLDGGSGMYSKVLRSDPVAFPAYYEPDAYTGHLTHILFGNNLDAKYINPYADMVKGYKEYSESKMQAQFELKQDLSKFVEGLSIRGLFSTSRYSFFDVKRAYNPYYYNIALYDPQEDSYILQALNPENGSEALGYDVDKKDISTTTYMEAAVNYNREFNEKHGVSGLLVFTRRASLKPNDESLELSLPSRNMGLAGRFTYSYNQKYFTEFNFGYNGSERFSENERWGFFPSVGLGYIISKEPFFDGGIKNVINNLKLKATYGLSGNDQIGDSEDRFFYLSNVNLNDGGKGYTWGEDFTNNVNGVTTKRYPNDKITWETSKKMNIGLEVGLFEKADISVDFYTEHRSNILMSRADIPPTMGLQATPKTNVGEAKGRGIDFSVDYNHSFNSDFWVTGRANFTYAISEYEVYEEVDNTDTPWLTHKGQSTSQTWGLVAERLFIDEYDVQNSPKQTFSEYGAGDIKYRDINGDGQITSLDKVPIGHPTRPEIIFGFGFSAGYKGFDFSCFFQGLANESFWIDAKKTAPFVDTDDDGNVISKNALLKVYADNHWSENNRDNHALWPRLSDKVLSNNTQTSTWFMRDGSFLRLKSLEVGYTIPKGLVRRIGLANARLYGSGTNLFTWSAFDLWDPEMAGNGMGYPIQKVYNFGVQVSF